MKKEKLPPTVSSETKSPPPAREDIQFQWHNVVRRRSFLKGVGIVGATLLLVLTRSGEAQRLSVRSWPPDTTPYARATVSEDTMVGTVGAEEDLQGIGRLFIRDVVVSNTNPNLKITDTFNDGETSIAINSQNQREIVITAFSGGWGANAPLWHSTDGGNTWTKRFTVPVPPGVPSAFGGPFDQTIDYGRQRRLSGAFLAADVYSGTTDNPANAAVWKWFVIGGVTQRTNLSGTSPDQPWLLANRDPKFASQDNIYVAYDDFNGAPNMRVAVSPSQVFLATRPPIFTRDQLSGFSTGFVNPGHRLAEDPRTGYIYSLFQRRVQPGNGGSQNINYMLNRSADGGVTWKLNGVATGIIVANADSTQPIPKFGTVNALLGGVLHAAVDPVRGDVYYVYGKREPSTGSNRLAIRRIRPQGPNGVIVGPEQFVTSQVGLVQAAIPSVAVGSNGTVGVFYYTFDGFSSGGFPIFSAHLSISTDRGITFSDHVLETFLSSAKDNGNSRQRVLGDYMQMKAVKNTFYGAFTGNGVPFGRPFANHDPIFFKVGIEETDGGDPSAADSP